MLYTIQGRWVKKLSSIRRRLGLGLGGLRWVLGSETEWEIFTVVYVRVDLSRRCEYVTHSRRPRCFYVRTFDGHCFQHKVFLYKLLTGYLHYSKGQQNWTSYFMAKSKVNKTTKCKIRIGDYDERAKVRCRSKFRRKYRKRVIYVKTEMAETEMLPYTLK